MSGDPYALNGASSRSAASGVARMEDDQRRELGPGAVRGVHQPGEDRQVVRRVGHGVAVEAEQVGSGVDRVGDQAAGDHVDGMQAVGERGGDAEVPAAAAQRPEQVRVRGRVDLEDLAVRGHELDAQQVVGREAVLGHQPAEPAAEGEAGDAGRRDRTPGHRQAVRAGGRVELVPGRAALRGHGGALGIDRDVVHVGEADHQAAVGHRSPGDVVAATADRHLEPVAAREGECRDHVAGRAGADDDCRAAVDEAVVDGPGLVVARVPSGEDGPGDPSRQVTDEFVVHCRAHAIGPFVATPRSCAVNLQDAGSREKFPLPQQWPGRRGGTGASGR